MTHQRHRLSISSRSCHQSYASQPTHKTPTCESFHATQRGNYRVPPPTFSNPKFGGKIPHSFSDRYVRFSSWLNGQGMSVEDVYNQIYVIVSAGCSHNNPNVAKHSLCAMTLLITTAMTFKKWVEMSYWRGVTVRYVKLTPATLYQVVTPVTLCHVDTCHTVWGRTDLFLDHLGSIWINV